MDGNDLKRVLREVFDARVFNHGDYNVVYGQPSGAGHSLTIGYRREPLELLFCPVDLTVDLKAQVTARANHHASPTTDIVTVGLSNVVTVADTGTGYQLQTSTGFRTWFEVTAVPRVPVPPGVGEAEDGIVALDQTEDSDDFHRFMTAFMDILDSYYPSEGIDG